MAASTFILGIASHYVTIFFCFNMIPLHLNTIPVARLFIRLVWVLIYRSVYDTAGKIITGLKCIPICLYRPA